MKRCPACGETKAPEMFAKNGRYLASYCKPCGVAKAKAARKKESKPITEHQAELKKVAARILSRCEEVGECLEWQGYVGEGGGIYARVGKKNCLARHILWDAENDSRPEGKYLSVKCGNPLCMRCLEWITRSEQNKRAAKKGAHKSTGFRLKMALIRRKDSKLSDDCVREIREWDGRVAEIAAVKRISTEYAHRIRAGNARKDYSSVWRGLPGMSA